MVVNQKTLGQCLGLTPRQIRNLRDDGMFQRPEGQRGYTLETCVQEYIEYKIKAETGHSASASREKVQAEHEEIKKQISILKLRKLRGELHEAADVEAFLSDMLIHFKNRLLSLPPKLAMQISGEKDINRIIGILTAGIHESLEELSEYDPDAVDGQKAGNMSRICGEEEEEDDG